MPYIVGATLETSCEYGYGNDVHKNSLNFQVLLQCA